MNKRKLGITIVIIALFIIGLGIGLKSNNPEMNSTPFTICGLALNAIGLFLLFSAKKDLEA